MNSLSYRKAALQHASTVGLVIALYDTLLGNLARATAALERNNIEARCAELTHGFKVLQQLDSMVDMQQGGAAAVNLRRFYGQMRRQMLAFQFKLSPYILRDQIRVLIDVREAWQQVDARGPQQRQPLVTTSEQPVEHNSRAIYTQSVKADVGHVAFSCSV